MLTLAQLGSAAADVPPLPEPGIVERLVLTSPLPTAIGVLIVGLVVATLLRRSGQARMARLSWAVGIGAVLAAAGVYVAGELVETPRERIMTLSDRLVDAAVKGDMATIESMIAPDCTLTLGSGPIIDRSGIMSYVRRAGSGSITSHSTGGHQGVIDAAAKAEDGISAGRTQFRVWAKGPGAFYDVAQGSTWLLYWQQEDGDEWQVVGIECLQIDNMRPEQMR